MNLNDEIGMNCQDRYKECQSYNGSTRWKMKNDCPKTCCDRGELYKAPRFG